MKYDVIVIGAGQAGPGMAAGYVGEGKKVALIEGDRLGGTCLNYGCRPTKALRASARVAHVARRAAEYGVNTGPVEVDFSKVMARKNDIIGSMQESTDEYFQNMEGLDLYYEYASFKGKENGLFQVQAGEHNLEAEVVYLNTGTSPFVPDIEGLDNVPYLTNQSILSLQERPEHMIVIGGGYVGLEFGQMFRRFGSEVTVIDRSEHIASHEDEDVQEAMESFLKDEGIKLVTSHVATKVTQADDGQIEVIVKHQGTGETTTLAGSHLLVALGRAPNTKKLNLDAIGVETDDKGFVPTDDKFHTNVEGIYALGDINKRGAFTHTSYQDYEIAWANHTGGDRSVKERIMAYVMFTDPPLGRVGMSEKDARQSDKRILMATYDMAKVSRARLDSETIGLFKVLVDADTEEILGATVMGMHADDVIAVFSNFMHTGASYKVMKEALPIHPTISEFIPTVLAELKPLE
ncbi:mercuric reductase [Phototrophicus methaneseepsis]|uniref:Mercuric reductase n=1 Tax=Phototrophicus methaneseepsis TaxID=2710758 RepID=A0A7S8IH50_9CHLR|nr:mercuric reductase [Phototrophicus methaneseepsis]QPC85048.1 mercuric reductase [Phototrophicus methaneseepsis]